MLAPTFSMSYSKVFPCAEKPLNFSFFLFVGKHALGNKKERMFWGVVVVWVGRFLSIFSSFFYKSRIPHIGANLNVWKSMESIDGKVYT